MALNHGPIQLRVAPKRTTKTKVFYRQTISKPTFRNKLQTIAPKLFFHHQLERVQRQVHTLTKLLILLGHLALHMDWAENKKLIVRQQRCHHICNAIFLVLAFPLHRHIAARHITICTLCCFFLQSKWLLQHPTAGVVDHCGHVIKPRNYGTGELDVCFPLWRSFTFFRKRAFLCFSLQTFLDIVPFCHDRILLSTVSHWWWEKCVRRTGRRVEIPTSSSICICGPITALRSSSVPTLSVGLPNFWTFVTFPPLWVLYANLLYMCSPNVTYQYTINSSSFCSHFLSDSKLFCRRAWQRTLWWRVLCYQGLCGRVVCRRQRHTSFTEGSGWPFECENVRAKSKHRPFELGHEKKIFCHCK